MVSTFGAEDEQMSATLEERTYSGADCVVFGRTNEKVRWAFEYGSGLSVRGKRSSDCYQRLCHPFSRSSYRRVYSSGEIKM